MAQQHLDRLTAVDASFLAQEGPASHMHIGGIVDLRGPAAAATRRCSTTSGRGCTSCRATASGSPQPPLETGRPAVGRRPDVQPRVPRPPDRAARAGHRGPAHAAGRADHVPAARPLQAAVGDVDRRGPRGRRLRADLQDPPRADRRHQRRRPRDGACSTSRPCPPEVAAPRRAVAAAARADRRRARRRRRGRAGARPRRRRRRRAAARSRSPQPRRCGALREAAEGLGEVAWAGHEPGARDAAERRDRPAPALRGRAQPARRTSRRSRTRSAARSTTSC